MSTQVKYSQTSISQLRLSQLSQLMETQKKNNEKQWKGWSIGELPF